MGRDWQRRELLVIVKLARALASRESVDDLLDHLSASDET
jgi:hypothetical protein